MGTRQASLVTPEEGGPTGGQAESAQENRASSRRRVLRTGKVVLQNGSVFDCAVRNISDTGAQIRIVEPIPLPAKFSLYWPETRMIRECDNRWQRGVDCGIAFTAPARLTLRDYT